MVSYVRFTHNLDLFIHVPFQLPFRSIQHLQPFRRYELIAHIVISDPPGTHLHLSQVKRLVQGHSIEIMSQY